MNLAYNDYLKHHGIKGQKWGIRRYQNSDGTLTSEGKRRYGSVLEAQSKSKRILNSVKEWNKKVNEKYQKGKITYTDNQIKEFIKRDYGIDTEMAEMEAKEYGYKSVKEMYEDRTNSFLKRDVNNSEKTIKFFEDAYKKYSDMLVADVSKKDIKLAKKFVDHVYFDDRSGIDESYIDYHLSNDRKRYNI